MAARGSNGQFLVPKMAALYPCDRTINGSTMIHGGAQQHLVAEVVEALVDFVQLLVLQLTKCEGQRQSEGQRAINDVSPTESTQSPDNVSQQD
eukprot:773746-Rhodomonas_salina.1